MKIMWVSAIALGLAGTAAAGSITEMVGVWEWEGYEITVNACDDTTICAEVTDGPQNVGLQMLKTTPEAAGEAWTAQVVHPATNALYFAKMEFDGADAWTMAGCTENGVCAEGVFTRK